MPKRKTYFCQNCHKLVEVERKKEGEICSICGDQIDYKSAECKAMNEIYSWVVSEMKALEDINKRKAEMMVCHKNFVIACRATLKKERKLLKDKANQKAVDQIILNYEKKLKIVNNYLEESKRLDEWKEKAD